MTEFETAFEKHRRNMYRAARRIGIPHAQAQDAVQEAGKRLSQMSTIQYVDPHRVSGLFSKVTINCARTIMTRGIKTAKMHEEYGQAEKITHQGPSRRDKEVTTSITVHRALSSLPELDSYIGWKYYALQMSLREISEDLKRDKNVDWDHVRIHRHLRKVVFPALKKALEELGGQSL